MSIFTSEDAALNAAAIKAGIRTAAQAARGAGAAVVVAIGSTVVGVDWLVVGGIVGAGVVTTVWAGIDAYLGILSKGVPAEYQDVAFNA